MRSLIKHTSPEVSSLGYFSITNGKFSILREQTSLEVLFDNKINFAIEKFAEFDFFHKMTSGKV